MTHQHDLPYDFEDFGMEEDALKVKYPSGHPHYSIEGWNTDSVGQVSTNGYWDWVISKIAEDDESIPSSEDEDLETVHVESMDQFIQLLAHWHKEKIKVLEHMLQVPEGVEVHFNENEPEILKGDLHKGFRMGLSLALMELDTLPFAVEIGEEGEPCGPTKH